MPQGLFIFHAVVLDPLSHSKTHTHIQRHTFTDTHRHTNTHIHIHKHIVNSNVLALETLSITVWEKERRETGERGGVNFTNILRAAILFKSIMHSFTLLRVFFSNPIFSERRKYYLVKELAKKLLIKMSVKLTLREAMLHRLSTFTKRYLE